MQERNTLLATLVFGAAVTVVHFTAIWQTTVEAAGNVAAKLGLGNSQMALLVMLPVFMIAGAFFVGECLFAGTCASGGHLDACGICATAPSTEGSAPAAV